MNKMNLGGTNTSESKYLLEHDGKYFTGFNSFTYPEYFASKIEDAKFVDKDTLHNIMHSGSAIWDMHAVKPDKVYEVEVVFNKTEIDINII